MNLRWGIATIIAVFAAGAALAIFAIRLQEPVRVDMIALNELVKTLESRWDEIEQGDYSFYEEPFTVLSKNGDILYRSDADSNQAVTIHEAIRNRDTIVDLTVHEQDVGRIIVHHQNLDTAEQMKERLTRIVAVSFLGLAVLSILYLIYLEMAVFRPFRKLQRFASQVARGNLDLPLSMDKRNPFGAFTESFDLMREELAAARQKAYEANRSKQELVASLSHDIKTPLASIKAVTELMLLQATDEKLVKQLNTIHSKAEQVNYLVTDMFHSTLEELQQLKVTITEESSAVLAALIENANFDNRIRLAPIPECIILADVMRLQQVLDNVLSNSYKYAATDVAIESSIERDYLILHIMDYGPGIREGDLPLVFQKFYRGGNSEGINGSGLGLYLAKYFMEKMQGGIECHNRSDGFSVILSLKLAD